jgi:hypothetical protein
LSIETTIVLLVSLWVPRPPGFNSTISAFGSDGTTPWERALELFTAMAVAEVQQDVAWQWENCGDLMGFSFGIHGINDKWRFNGIFGVFMVIIGLMIYMGFMF